MNVHTPERAPDESMLQYRNRRARSKRLLASITKPPTQTPAVSLVDTSRFWLGLHRAPEWRRQRRVMVRAAGGIRQYKRTLRT